MLFSFLSAFVIGPLFTTYILKDYFSDVTTYKYMLNGILLLQHRLPGVFSDNIYTNTVNGSLWTLPVEFLCYIIVYILYKLRLLKYKSFFISIPIALVFELGVFYVAKTFGIQILAEIIRPTLLFYIGIMYYTYRSNIVLRFDWAIATLIGLIISNGINILNVGILLFFPYLVIYLCYGIKQVSNRLGNLGNYSYAIYLSGFPIQQMLISIYRDMSIYLNAFLSILGAVFIGVILTEIIEKPIAKVLKNKMIKKELPNVIS